ncbi:MAG: DUF5688 family protein [Eubacterium sp.]|nr:DUF5688 family protein [Eubacterium sp.]MDY5497916.1 DUF5688 family protein [Anaerobutyricum sp.]
MDFDEFRAYIEEHILEGWMEDAAVAVNKVRKNNGVELWGLFIRKEGERVCPAIYLEECFEYYEKGEDPEEILARIREEYEWMVQKVSVFDEDLSRFSCVKDRIIYRLVNYEKNREILEECPHLRLYDLALTFRWVAHTDAVGISTALVTNKEMKAWDVCMNQLLLAAGENTKRLFPPMILSMDDMLREAGIPVIEGVNQTPMYIMTNRQEVNGASVLLYEGCLRTFAGKKKSDFYILPSSIHELILVPADSIDSPEGLFDMVRDANRTVVTMGDVLSDSVYYYERKHDRVFPLKK